MSGYRAKVRIEFDAWVTDARTDEGSVEDANAASRFLESEVISWFNYHAERDGMHMWGEAEVAISDVKPTEEV